MTQFSESENRLSPITLLDVGYILTVAAYSVTVLMKLFELHVALGSASRATDIVFLGSAKIYFA